MKGKELIQQMIDGAKDSINVALPARILEYRPEELRAKIELLAKKELEGEMKVVPPILEVPVMTLKTGTFVIMPPYEKDDVGQVIFNDKALDKLVITGEPEDAELKREHSLDDAVFLGGLQTEQEENLPDPEDNLWIGNRDGETKLKITPGGELIIDMEEILVGSDSAGEPIPLGDMLENWLQNHTHTGNMGAPTSPPLQPTTGILSRKSFVE